MLPVLARAKDKARATNCMSNLKQWGVNWNLYCGDYNDFFPSGQNPDGSIDGNARSAWFNAVQSSQATSIPQIVTCPMATVSNANSAILFGGLNTGYVMPNASGNVDKYEHGEVASYGMNLFSYDAHSDIQSRPQALHWRKISASPHSSETPLMADSMWRGGGPFTSNGQLAYQPAPQPGLESQAGLGGNENAEMQHFWVPRHNGGQRVQMVFFDGSASSVKCKNLWGYYWNVGWDPNFIFGNYPPASSFWPQWIQQE